MPESVVHFQIRMPPQQHEKLASWAKDEKVSLNLLVVGILEKAIEHRKAEASAPKGATAHAGK
jgi:predicted HicB family RNase H-like nuclease